MYIKWVKHPTDPMKDGVREDVPRTVAENSIWRGEAKQCAPPNYGTAAWIAERQAAAAKAVPFSGDVDPNSKGVEWGIRDKAQSQFSRVAIIKRCGCETTFFSEPPADCPPSIVAQWLELTLTEDVAGAARTALLAAQQKQYAQKSEEKKGVLSQIFTGK